MVLIVLVVLLGCDRPCGDACHREAALAAAPVDWAAALDHVAAIAGPHERAAAVLEVARLEQLTGAAGVSPAQGLRLCALSPSPEVARQCEARFARPHMLRALDGPGPSP